MSVEHRPDDHAETNTPDAGATTDQPAGLHAEERREPAGQPPVDAMGEPNEPSPGGEAMGEPNDPPEGDDVMAPHGGG